MSWVRLDLATLEPDILKLIAAATDPGSRLTPAAIRETALALLCRARTLPPLQVADDDVPPPAQWVGTRYVAEKGETAVSFWKEQAESLFQAEWENKSLHSLLVQIGERIWTSDPERLQGWDYDARRVLETADTARQVADTKSRAADVINAWDRENHPKSGWRCAACGWQNRPEDTTCIVCFTPQHPVAVNPRAEWKERAAVPPPPFDEPGVGRGAPGEAVELHLPGEVAAMLRRGSDRAGVSTDSAKERTSGPSQCWRCKAELKRQTRVCPRCGADQLDKPKLPSKPVN